MSLLVRKFDKAKWTSPSLASSPAEVRADAITGSLRTTGDTLSLWAIGSMLELDEAVLALLCSHDKLETIDVLVLEETELNRRALDIEATEGITAYKDFEQAHRDLVQLDYGKLGVVANYMLELIREKQDKRYTMATCKQILESAIVAGKVSVSNLKPKLAEKLSTK